MHCTNALVMRDIISCIYALLLNCNMIARNTSGLVNHYSSIDFSINGYLIKISIIFFKLKIVLDTFEESKNHFRKNHKQRFSESGTPLIIYINECMSKWMTCDELREINGSGTSDVCLQYTFNACLRRQFS